MADTAVVERDLGVEIRQPVEEPEKQEDLRKPDDKAAWAISLNYTFEEEACKDLRARAKKGFDYQNGEQWDPKTRATMEDSSNPRPVLTFNEIRPKIEALIGEERRNREDWVAKPREGSDDTEAETRTALLKYVRDMNELPASESRAFEEGIIGGYGGLVCDLIQRPEGGPPALRIEYRPWREFRWDWTSRNRDFSDAQWMGISILVDPSRLAELLPDHKDTISAEYDSLSNDPLMEEAEDVGERIGVTRYRDATMRKSLYNVRERRIRALQFYYRTTRTREILTIQTPHGPMTREVPEGDARMRAIADTLVGNGTATKTTRKEPAIRGILVVGRRTLAQWWSPFNGRNAFGQPYFPIFLFFASDTDGRIMGLVEPMMSPQDEVNKRWSMTVENYLHQARSGGMYEDGAFENETEAKAKWGSPGYWAKLRQGAIAANKVKEHTAKPTDNATMTLYQMAEKAMDRVSNIDPARLGMTSREESGVALRTRALQSAMVQVKAFDNFRYMQLLLGRFINANLHLMFPVPMTLRLTMPNGQNKEVTLNQQVQVGAAIKIVNDTRAGSLFDIVMDLTPSNATFREMQAQNLANLLGQIGPPMKEIPHFLPAYAEMLKSLVGMLDGMPNRTRIEQLLDIGIRGMLGGAAPGPSGAATAPPRGPGAPPPPPDTGLPFMPAGLTGPPGPGPVTTPMAMATPGGM
jgi:hypothetical protein